MSEIVKYICLFVLFLSQTSCSSNNESGSNNSIACSPTQINLDYNANERIVEIRASEEWSAYSNENWIICNPSSSINTEGSIKINIQTNQNAEGREGNIIVKCGTSRTSITIKQEAKPETPKDPNINTPAGYKLVWNDEFDKGTEPSSDWSYETGAGGWGNNELQNYVAGYKASEQLAIVKDGVLSIIAKKIESTVYSIRMNTNESWKYGYFEARLKLPSGKGTWPAFWMMPKNFTLWPADGEIDIMEEVGYRPNYVSSAIHCTAYNHSIGSEKTKEKLLSTSQNEFHIYALEWTEDYIRTYVDGIELFYFENDKQGNKNTWPFNAPFYIKLNLAWGGNWGGAQGVDESVLPATYQIDYVRVFQKK